MEIQFENPQLRETCLLLVPMSEALPRAVLSALRDVINEMRNASNLDELLLGQPGDDDLIHDLDWPIELAQGYTAIFRINHSRPPAAPHGIDRSRVHRVRIMAIRAPHV